MTEGWFGDDYLISLNEAEVASASDRYSISRFIPGHQVIGLRGWDDLIVRDSVGLAHSPYGTQIFFTWVACCRNQRPSPCFTSNQSMERPSLVNTCLRFPIEYVLAATVLALSVKHQTASTSSCSAKVFNSCDV